MNITSFQVMLLLSKCNGMRVTRTFLSTIEFWEL